MNLLKNTISLCPECLLEIPASIYDIEGAAIMQKVCSEHGYFESMIERDAEYYKLVQQHNAAMFYDGLIIDVTYRCNIRCKWCFQHLEAYDVPVERIYKLASQMPPGHKIILSGGEPTLRDDLPAIICKLADMGYAVNVITNGYRIKWDLPCRWTLSHHPESQELFSQRITEAREGKHQFSSIIYTDNTLDDYYQHVTEALTLADICTVFRMHAAAPVGGNLDDNTNAIFVSDMWKTLIVKGHELSTVPGKTIFQPLTVDGVPFMLISWNTKYNVDVCENFAEPWYHGKGNTVDNLVTRVIRDN